MNGKRIMVVLLGLGALVIVVLLGVGYILSSNFKSELQNALNDNFKKVAGYFNQVAQETGLTIKLVYEPFACEGIKSYRCLSKHISFVSTNTEKTLAGLNNFSFNIEDISTSSIRTSINLPSLSLEVFDKIQKNEIFYEALKPIALNCKEEDKILNKKTGEINSNTQCRITAHNVEYRYNVTQRIQSEKFVNQKILHSLLYFYSNYRLFDQKNNVIKDFNFAIDKFSFGLIESKNIKSILYPILEEIYNMNMKVNPKSQFNDEAYEKMLEQAQRFAGFGLVLSGIFGSPFQEAFENFLEGLKQIALGKASEVNLTLLPKVSPAPYFQINQILENIREGTQQELMTKIFDNYDLVSKTIINKTDETK